ncbi:MAG TPA: hypothetical protein VG267_00025 [Terracidiphilus sp.]|nr:hypothetical protein [Terracidiphilus sp.]
MSRSLLSLVVLLAGSTLAVIAQTGSTTKTPAVTSSPAAYVYVQTSSGVVGYSAASNGTLTKITGSPFKTAGLLAGSTGYAFYSVGTDWIHTYKVAANGAIGAQESQINTQNYSGADCGQALGGAAGVLDHSGKYFYNLLNNYGNCAAYQTYTIGKNGMLTFNNWTQISQESGGGSTIPTILGNESFAYAIAYFTHQANIIGFAREKAGDLQAIKFLETDPANSDTNWTPSVVTADPTNHLAAILLANDSNPGQLASFTVDTHGNITSTNTSANMPFANFAPTNLAMSPSGLLLAVCGDEPPVYGLGDGLQIFHFNGANPMTPYSGSLTKVAIDAIKWDTSNHVYAISYSTNQIFVFTVTPTSISAAPGSPYTIAAPTALFVKAL